MVASEAASAAGLSSTWSEWQGMVWLWCIDADAILIRACPWMRQRGAQNIQDWPTRNAVSIINAASRTSGREDISLRDLLDGLMRSKVARGEGEGQAGSGEAGRQRSIIIRCSYVLPPYSSSVTFSIQFTFLPSSVS
jgi:hypothetical protein